MITIAEGINCTRHVSYRCPVLPSRLFCVFSCATSHYNICCFVCLLWHTDLSPSPRLHCAWSSLLHPPLMLPRLPQVTQWWCLTMTRALVQERVQAEAQAQAQAVGKSSFLGAPLASTRWLLLWTRSKRSCLCSCGNCTCGAFGWC